MPTRLQKQNKEMEDMDTEGMHSLTSLIECYCNEYEHLRETYLDLPNIRFHRDHGLAIQSPANWDILGSIKDVVGSFSDEHKIVVIFSSTAAYRKTYDTLDSRVQYLSWHEVFTGMHIAKQDVRYIQRVKKILDEADLTFFLNPPDLPEVIDQVRGQTSGALVILSGGELDV